MLRRVAPAFAVALLTYVATSQGFFVSWRAALVGLLPGMVAALLTADALEAGLAGANGVAWGFLISPLAASSPEQGRTWLIASAFLAVAVAAAVAWAVARLRAWNERSGAVVAGVALAGVLVVMWSGALAIAGSGMSGDTSLITALETPFEPYQGMVDVEVYLTVQQAVNGGAPYYTALHDVLSTQTDRYDVSVLNYRLPTLQWLWASLPGGAWRIVLGMLLFGTLAVLAAFRLASRAAGYAAGLLSAAVVATLYLRMASGPYLLEHEPWAAALLLAALALFVESVSAEGRTRLALLWSAAAFALAAALTREVAVYFSLGALAASLISAEERGRRTWLPWAAALAAFTALYGAHFAHVRSLGYLAASQGASAAGYLTPPAGHFQATVAYGTWLLGGQPWLPWALIALAVAGCLGLGKRSARTVALWAAAAPLAVFVFAGPLTVTGEPAGYWGMLVTPVVAALAATSVRAFSRD